jgi:hypothetical protein
LRRYLDGVPEDARNTWTCLNQNPWHNYEKSTPPQMLFHSAFTGHAPTVMINEVRAISVGSVYGVYAPKGVSLDRLLTYLATCDVEAHVVPHAKTLRKLEVRQLNALLGDWWHVNADQ